MNTTQNLVSCEETPAHILRDAALYVAFYGWHQGGTFADNGDEYPPACTIGAIRYVVLGDTSPYVAPGHDSAPLYWSTVDVLAMYLLNSGAVNGNPEELLTMPDLVVASWNDDPNRNVAQVLGALNGAAADWDTTHPGGGAR